jgi:hypothetical protein
VKTAQTALDSGGTRAYLDGKSSPGYRINLSDLPEAIAAKLPPPLPDRFQTPGRKQ